jgi:hypothetical protein
MKKKIKQPNIMTGYDENGELSMYYWQKEPFIQRSGSFYTIPKRKWFNPVWRIKQWYLSRKPIQFQEFKDYINK